jgi:hypothetical protein
MEGDLEANGARQKIKALGSSVKRKVLNQERPESGAVSMPMIPQPVHMTTALNPLTRPELVRGETGATLTLGPSREEVVAARIRELAAQQALIRDPDVTEGRERSKCKLYPISPVLKVDANRDTGRRTLAKAFPGF